MTLEEYLSPELFPLTTQEGLEPEQQFFLDAYRADAIKEMEELGQPFTPRGEQIRVEIQHKMESYQELLKEATGNSQQVPTE